MRLPSEYQIEASPLAYQTGTLGMPKLIKTHPGNRASHRHMSLSARILG